MVEGTHGGRGAALVGGKTGTHGSLETRSGWRQGNGPHRSPGEVGQDRVQGRQAKTDRKSTRLNSSHTDISRMPSSA